MSYIIKFYHNNKLIKTIPRSLFDQCNRLKIMRKHLKCWIEDINGQFITDGEEYD